jgi:hypothetical protein
MGGDLSYDDACEIVYMLYAKADELEKRAAHMDEFQDPARKFTNASQGWAQHTQRALRASAGAYREFAKKTLKAAIQ